MGNLFSSPASPPGSPVSARASPPGTDALSQVEFGQGQGSASGGTGNASKKKKEKGKKGGEATTNTQPPTTSKSESSPQATPRAGWWVEAFVMLKEVYVGKWDEWWKMWGMFAAGAGSTPVIVVNFGLLILESLVALFKLLLVLSELKVPPRHGLARQIILSAVGIFLLHHVIAYFCLAEVHWLSPAVPFLEEKYAAFTDTVQALLAEGLRTLKTSLRVGAVPE